MLKQGAADLGWAAEYRQCGESVRCLQVGEYGELSGASRLTLLEALVSLAADTELVRGYLHDRSLEAADDKVSRGTPLGTDASGTRYFQLAAAAGRVPPPRPRERHCDIDLPAFNFLRRFGICIFDVPLSPSLEALYSSSSLSVSPSG